ncbi:potassium efflux P-type ATPase [Coleophoma cylindrospora]|uniref:P-type Na(+) transporter n=1 Tax=Coleophoma cylindrospora TaxID=1849047 RepID=A0A3D8Q8T3_9HELO|nr:potassium efflux P-type ATPase [Coleophoma cylindrospora]
MKPVDSLSAEANPGSKDPLPRPLSQLQIDGKEQIYAHGTTATNSVVSSFPAEPGDEWGDVAQVAHVLDVDYISQKLNVDVQYGLRTEDAIYRLGRDGPNRLRGTEGTSVWRILMRQVSNSLTLVLVIAMALSYGINDYIEGAVITAVIFLNIVVGFFQDYRAEETMQSLKALSAPVCKVVRDSGHVQSLKAEDLVAGDIVQLATGDIIPADLRLFHGLNLETNEALLTGESLPIVKTPFATMDSKDLSPGDRTNMAFSASTVTKGRGAGIVIATGTKTEVGQISELLNGGPAVTKSSNFVVRAFQNLKHALKNTLGLVGTPLQVKLSWFALLLLSLAILLAIIVFSVNKFNVSGEVLLYGVCVAVAIIPESLIAVLTITMSVGTKAMAKQNVVVRKLQAIEAVGGVTNICSDKTGTLTQGKMVVRRVWIQGCGMITVSDTRDILDPTTGSVALNEQKIDPGTVEKNSGLLECLNAVSLCNLATIYEPKPGISSSEKELSRWTAVGDPTEIALQVFAMRFDHGKSRLLLPRNLNLVAEHPFDSSIKRMSVAYEDSTHGKTHVYAKGALESLLPILNASDNQKAAICTQAETMARDGLRVLCIAFKSVPNDQVKTLTSRNMAEEDLVFLGLVGVYDPPRPGALESVKKCHHAGITVHMLTGDHISTATAIAKEVGIIPSCISAAPGTTTVITASVFDAMSDAEIDALPELPLVIARCSPTTKVSMVSALHRRQKYVSMTGDGVNDAPALKRADVGIAMGLNGSDVAKDCADMVLTDDDFSSIVRAIGEGRRLFDNIQKFLLHLLISNISQVVLLLVGLAFQDAENHSVFPLSPLEILWVNMITSSFLALGLGMEAASPDLMSRPPHSLRTGVFTKELIIDKMVYGCTMGVLCLVAFISVVYGKGDGNLGQNCNDGYNDTCYTVYRARATVFSVLSCLLLVTAWEVKHFSRSLFNLYPSKYTGPFNVWPAVRENRFLFWAVVGGLVTTFPVVYIPIVNRVVFKHLGIGWEWGVVIGCVMVYLGVLEAWKAGKRRFGLGSDANIVLRKEAVTREGEAV